MKIANLMVAITSATLLGLSTLPESSSAQIRRTGNTYSQTGTNEFSVGAQYNLVDTRRDGTRIFDEVPRSQVTGLFLGAIEDYARGFGEVCGANVNAACSSGTRSSVVNNNASPYQYDSLGYPILINYSPQSKLFDGDLFVQLFNPEEDNLFPDSKEIVVAYSILKSGTNQLASIAAGASPFDQSATTTYRLLPSGYSSIPDFDLDQAVNDIDYILMNNLLGRARPATLGGFSINDDGIQVYVAPEIQPGLGEVLVQNQFEVQVAGVPEPSMTLGALVALGAGGLLKRKLKQS